jgi:hypothetical protein
MDLMFIAITGLCFAATLGVVWVASSLDQSVKERP